MKKIKKICLFILLVFLSIPNVYAGNNLKCVSCGDANQLPAPVPKLTSIAFALLIVAVPLILIAFSIVALVKATMAGKADEIMKAKSKLIKKVIATVIIFLVAGIVQFVMVKVGDATERQTILNCMNCLLYGECEEVDCSYNDTNRDSATSNSPATGSNRRPNSNSNSSSNGGNTPAQKGELTILVGDSRTVGICGDTSSTINNSSACRDVWAVRRGGMGYNWFKNTALNLINAQIQKNPNKRHNIVILLGVNDVGDQKAYADAAANQYISIIQSQIDNNWKNHNVIFVSSGPINVERIGGQWPISQSNISYFNSLMKSKIPAMGKSNVKYCDIEAELKSGLAGKYWSDNLHYNTEGSKFYYDTVMNKCL